MKVITFKLGQEHFGIDISYLEEIKSFKDLKNTYVPNSPAMLEGLVNLRGNLVPVLNLGVIFNIKNEGANVIILSLKGRTIGVFTGSIGKIVDINNSELERPPSTTSKEEVKYISGIKRLDDKIVVILEPENLLEINGVGVGSRS